MEEEYRVRGYYFHRETLTKSLEGRPLELVTLSGINGITTVKEDPLPIINTLDGGETLPERSFIFESKPVIFVTCRVHCGETPGQYMV